MTDIDSRLIVKGKRGRLSANGESRAIAGAKVKNPEHPAMARVKDSFR
jgi:hypothetical protein